MPDNAFSGSEAAAPVGAAPVALGALSVLLHENAVVLDLHAGDGARSLEIAERVGPRGKVHAFEPNPAQWSALRAAAARATRQNIEIHPFGAGRVAESLPGDSAPTVGCFQPIDGLGLIGVDLILFGAALADGAPDPDALFGALLGALATIARSRPVIFFAGARSAAETAKIEAFAEEISYRAVTLTGPDASDAGLALAPAERAPRLLRDFAETEFAVAANLAVDASCEKRPLLIAIGFYKAPELVNFIVEGLLRIAPELRRNQCLVQFYNDSPDDPDLRAALVDAQARLAGLDRLEIIENPQNLGFIATMNLAFAQAKAEGRDLLLLNSDAMPAPGAIDEMRFVAAQDPMIGFVCPRSNNATLATAGEPVQVDFEDPDQRRQLERRIEAASRFLPRAQYVPTNVGFCLLIKHQIITEFGALSLDYGKGYNEENDYVMRAGQCGFRAALANWAYSYHIGEKSFDQSDTQRRARDLANREILVARYPEYPKLEAWYFASETNAAEAFLTRLVDGRIRFAIDAGALFVGHNGTQHLIATLIREIERLYGAVFDLAVIGDPQAFAFHGLDRLARARLSPPEGHEIFDVILRIGQPFQPLAPEAMARRAPVNLFFMLDTIALDCAQLYTPQLEALWDYVMTSADGVIYNSGFTQAQFRRRFAIDPRVTAELVSHHSLKPIDYRANGASATPRDPHVLIVGNHFPHKDVAPTYEHLARCAPGRKYVALGADTRKIEREGGVVDEFYTAGRLSSALIADLYENADLVVFPSYYEGFGFPIESAFAAQKPVLARATAVNHEIAALLGSPNLHLYRDRDELADMVRTGVAWCAEAPKPDAHGWEASAREIVEFCLQRLNACSTERVKSRRKALRALLVQIAPPPAPVACPPPPAEAPTVAPAPLLEQAPQIDRPLIESELDADARRILLKSLRSLMLSIRVKRALLLWSAKGRRRYRATLREAKRLRASIDRNGVIIPPAKAIED